jgi:hypothetical protein
VSVVILFTDLRAAPSKLKKHILEWQPNLTAKQALEMTLGQSSTAEIEKELKNNSHELIVSWYNKRSNEISEIGGLGEINWIVPDDTVITVSYENENTTEQQINESVEWMLSQKL